MPFYIQQVVLMAIMSYIANFNNDHYAMPSWQRGQQVIWTKEYRDKLIESILWGIDIPKIYIGNLIAGARVIIDGGHRTRALRDFMNNEYPVTIGEDKVFYSEIPMPHELRGHRIMTEEERSTIRNFRLTIVTYDNITEKDARMIFNRLQNSAPMTMPDVVNSWESPLVNYLRELNNLVIMNKTLYQHFETIKSLPKPDNNEFLYHCLSWFTIINPPENSDVSDSENALKFIEKGKTRNSACFKFLQNFDTYSDEVTNEMKTRFEDAITSLITFLIRINTIGRFQIPNGDQATLIHSRMYVENFSIDEFSEFLDTVNDYKSLKSESEKLFKKGQRPLANTKAAEMERLDADNGLDISKWIKSRAANPTGVDSVKARKALVERKFCDTESSSSEEEYFDENFIPNEGEDVPLVGNV